MMEREIKFRCWDKEKNRMSNPIPIYFPIITWNDGDIEMPTDFGIAKSERFLFLQYTGLKDKNGKEIYEGDIVDVETKGKLFRGKVKWNPQSASFIIINEKRYLEIISMAQFGGEDYPTIHLDQTEAIGNIYETPELLKP